MIIIMKNTKTTGVYSDAKRLSKDKAAEWQSLLGLYIKRYKRKLGVLWILKEYRVSKDSRES